MAAFLSAKLSFALHPTAPSKPPKRKALPKRRKSIATPDGDGSDVDQLDDGDETPTPKGKPKVKSRDIQGLKCLDMIAPLLERLHKDMCDRDSAGNRDPHYDQYGMLVLLYLFKPIVTALRSIP